jgi:hypothetical protein
MFPSKIALVIGLQPAYDSPIWLAAAAVVRPTKRPSRALKNA